MVSHYVPSLQRIYPHPQAHSRGRNTHYGSQCCCGRPRHHGYRLSGYLRTNRLRGRGLLAPQGHRLILRCQRVYGRNAPPTKGSRGKDPHYGNPHSSRIRHRLQSRGRTEKVRFAYRQNCRTGDGRRQFTPALRTFPRSNGSHPPLPTRLRGHALCLFTGQG